MSLKISINRAKFILASIVILACNESAFAQYYMKVFRNDGPKVQYALSDIDSLSVLEPSTTDEENRLVLYSKFGYPAAYFNIGSLDSISYKKFDADKNPLAYSIERLSDDISAFESSNWATIRFKTTPWDILNTDNSFSIRISDTLGVSNGLLETGEQTFIPADSSWEIQVKIKDSRAKSANGSISLVQDDVILKSCKFTLMKVSFKMKSVKNGSGGGSFMDYDSKTGTYTLCLPTTTDFSAQRFLFSHSGQKVTVGDSLLREKVYNTLDASKPLTVSVWMYDLHKDYIIKMTNTGLPVVRITSDLNMKQYDRVYWVPGATMRIEMPDGTVNYEGTLSLKGRGNGTWTEPKKKTIDGQDVYKRPFAIKLDEKAKILGMHKQKRWILLANYKDRTLLRNDAAYWLSRQTEFPYTIEGQFVELVWNGVHVGNYYLCEQARIDNHRIDIVNPNLEEPEKGGYFVEIDTYLGYYSYWEKGSEIGFWSSKFNLPYIFKDPDDTEIDENSASYIYFKNYIEELETILKDETRVKNHEYEQYLDVDKAIDYALIQELTLNHDSYNTWPEKGPHSAFLYKDSCGLLCYGPVWDFDYHTFMPTCPDGNDWMNPTDLAKEWVLLYTSAKTSSGKYYFEYLLKDPKFKNRLVERWDMYKNKWKELPDYIDMMADSIRVSESCNWSIWGSTNPSDINPNGDQNKDLTLGFQGSVDRMKEGFLARWEWLEKMIHKL